MSKLVSKQSQKKKKWKERERQRSKLTPSLSLEESQCCMTFTKPWDESHTINRAIWDPKQHSTQVEMSSKEAVDSDGRATKEGSVWETRIMVNQEKTRSSRITMSNAEIQVDKKADNITPKQSLTAPTTAKNKTAAIPRQRSDLPVKKSPPQIKRSRSAAATSVKDEVNLVKLRKIKSHSAKLDNSLPLQLVETTKSVDETAVVGDDKQDKPLTNNADVEEEEEVEKEIEAEVEKRSIEIKDLTINLEEEKPKKLVIVEKKSLHCNDRSPPVTPIVKKIAPAVNHATRIHPTPAKLNPNHHHGASSRLQSFADLIMWKDVSRSAFVFGIGAFSIISSSYTKDLNISCISVLSYIGLVYLAVSFTIRSLITRGNIDMDSRDEEYVLGEEEAVWLIKLVLPYLNEFLSTVRSLFSGDPATTMKLALLLFILARCGGSITIWKMTKLGFFGVFMLPKLYSSYSSQLAAQGTFWIRRFGDAWGSCSHKKAVAFGIFSLVWNLSSVVARIWTLFLLFVAFRYYQHCRIIHEEGPLTQISNTIHDTTKQKKRR